MPPAQWWLLAAGTLIEQLRECSLPAAKLPVPLPTNRCCPWIAATSALTQCLSAPQTPQKEPELAHLEVYGLVFPLPKGLLQR